MDKSRSTTCLPCPRKASLSCCALLPSALVDTFSSGSSSAFSSATYGSVKRPSALPAAVPSRTSPARKNDQCWRVTAMGCHASSDTELQHDTAEDTGMPFHEPRISSS